MSEITWPWGKEEGTPVSKISDRNAQWGAANARKRDLKAACEEECKRRGLEIPAPDAPKGARNSNAQERPAAPPAKAAPEGQQAITTVGGAGIVGSFRTAAAATKALFDAARDFHLVSPATVVGNIPEGLEVAINLVQIDPYGSEVYNITGDKNNPKDTDTVGIDKIGLHRIFKAMGGEWVRSRRTDDGSHPHYCAWEAVAKYVGFDMQEHCVPGNVDIDTREDGPVRGASAEEIRTKAEARRRKWPEDNNDGGDAQLLELRKFLIRHAESKAMNKAIGNCGVRRSYKRVELRKPFAVAQLVFTGYSEDPEARRDFRQMVGQRFLGRGGAREAAFGPSAPAPAALPEPQYRHAPPPIGTAQYQVDATGWSQPLKYGPAGVGHDDSGAPDDDQGPDEERL